MIPTSSNFFPLLTPPSQRQRLRQLILRQQQQKNALRQDKAQSEGPAGPAVAPPVGPPRPWGPDNFSVATPPADPFGRPPPPYPGTVRPTGGSVVPAPRFPRAFPVEQQQQRDFAPNAVPPPSDGLRGPAPR